MNWVAILSIGSGGFIGAILRAYLNGVFGKITPNYLPFGTLGVNLLGSFIIGILFAIFNQTDIIPLHVKSFLSTGILGALTTYSTFAFESFLLFEGGSYFLGILNVMLNAVGTVVFAGIGFKLFEYFLNIAKI